jgi:hypothetical protein
MRSTVFLVLVVLLGMTAVGCSRGAPTSPDAKATTDEQQHRAEPKALTAEERAEQDWGIPLYPGARVDPEAGPQSATQVTFSTPDSFEQVKAYYVERVHSTKPPQDYVIPDPGGSRHCYITVKATGDQTGAEITQVAAIRDNDATKTLVIYWTGRLGMDSFQYEVGR